MKKISDSKFIDVVLNSTCLKLNGNYGNFNTAEIIDNNNKKYFINAKYFIYGCGGIEILDFVATSKKYNALNQIYLLEIIGWAILKDILENC